MICYAWNDYYFWFRLNLWENICRFYETRWNLPKNKLIKSRQKAAVYNSYNRKTLEKMHISIIFMRTKYSNLFASRTCKKNYPQK